MAYQTDVDILAVEGGMPVRAEPMPARMALGSNCIDIMQEVISTYKSQGLDPGYQGVYEQSYCQDFAVYQGGGYADAVATGTLALFVAIAALNLPKGSHVLVSPITDPGTLSAITMNNLVPKLVDSAPMDYNIGVEQVLDRIDDKVSALVAVHSVGKPCPIDRIVSVCNKRGIRVVEDCSQSHGTSINDIKVGNFGDIAAFSTMYRKASITGPTGGVVYTRNIDLYHQSLAHADRGKPTWQEGFDDRNPNQFLFPALNLHSNEFSCAIGSYSIGALDSTRERRIKFLKQLDANLPKVSKLCRVWGINDSDSPFIYPVFVNTSAGRCTKLEFANALKAEGIPLNPHYQYLVHEWPWLKPYLADNFACQNATKARNETFCLYLNENYGDSELADILQAIVKVETYFLRRS